MTDRGACAYRDGMTGSGTARLRVSREQLLAYRRAATHLDARLPQAPRRCDGPPSRG